MQDKYMAYVGSYSYNGQAKGITVYDVDEKKGKFIYRCEVGFFVNVRRVFKDSPFKPRSLEATIYS